MNSRLELREAADREIWRLGGWLEAANRLGLTPEGLRNRVLKWPIYEARDWLDQLRQMAKEES